MSDKATSTPEAAEIEVADYFRTRGADVQRHVLLAGHQLDLVVEERLHSGLPVRIIVEVKVTSRPVTTEQIHQFASVVPLLSSEADLFLIVSRSGFTANARAVAESFGLRLLDLSDFIDKKNVDLDTDRAEVRRSLSAPESRTKVFISYCHADRRALDRLLVHLRPLEKQGLIDLWVDTRLKVGDPWKDGLDTAVRQARIAVLLVSADFLASDFILDNELPPLLLSARAEGARIIPVILSKCGYTRNLDLARLQSLNDPSRPLSSMTRSDKEALWDKVAREIIDLTSEP